MKTQNLRIRRKIKKWGGEKLRNRMRKSWLFWEPVRLSGLVPHAPPLSENLRNNNQKIEQPKTYKRNKESIEKPCFCFWSSLGCRDRPHMPFRCLDAQYRRELVRVYLTNVETICRKFVDEKRATLATLREDSQGFRAFLGSFDPTRRRKLAKENGEVLLKVRCPPPSPFYPPVFPAHIFPPFCKFCLFVVCSQPVMDL